VLKIGRYCSAYSHDPSVVVQIASGSALVSGFGKALRIRECVYANCLEYRDMHEFWEQLIGRDGSGDAVRAVRKKSRGYGQWEFVFLY